MNLPQATSLAVILLAFEGFIITLGLGIALFYIVRGLRMGRFWLKKVGLPQGQLYAAKAASETQRYSNKVTRPFVEAEAAKASAGATLGSIPGLFRRRRR